MLSTRKNLLLLLHSFKWRLFNKGNSTKLKTLFNMNNVHVGNFTYGDLNIYFSNYYTKLIIGKYCSIAPDVKFFLGGEHNYKGLSTYPVSKLTGVGESKSSGNIIVGDDVWIGWGSMILSGVKIGQGAIVGAGSTVAKDIPPYAIYAGNRIIKYRFSEDIIKKLEKFSFEGVNKEVFLKINEMGYMDFLNSTFFDSFIYKENKSNEC